MTKFRYTKEHLDFLRLGYPLMDLELLTAFFNLAFREGKRPGQIKACLNNHNITCGRKGNDRLINRTRLYTREQLAFLREGYKKYTIPELTRVFNKRFGTEIKLYQIRCCTRNHNMKSGRTGCFERGHRPWNDGTKGQGLTGPNPGSFKKGSVPPNRKPLYTERLSKDGFVEIKVPERNPITGFPTRYKHKHRWVWEQTHGPIPEGMVVAFKDSNPQNCEPENLMLISRAELLQLNRSGYKEVPGELKPSVLVLSKLQVKTRDRAKETA